MSGLIFRKTGAEVKAAAGKRLEEVKQRLERRNQALNEFMKDGQLVRSYLVRSSKPQYGHGLARLWSEQDISSEHLEEIRQLCERIYDLEQEAKRLQMIVVHLDDEPVFEIGYDDLASYGFDA
jgi:hypothetical protein